MAYIYSSYNVCCSAVLIFPLLTYADTIQPPYFIVATGGSPPPSPRLFRRVVRLGSLLRDLCLALILVVQVFHLAM